MSNSTNKTALDVILLLFRDVSHGSVSFVSDSAFS